MKTLTKLIAGILLTTLTLGLAGCAGGSADLSHKNVCSAFDKFGATKCDELQGIIDVLSMRTIEAEGGCYYTTDDKDEAKKIVESIIFRFDETPDCDYRECTYFVATSKDDNSTALIYVITYDDEKYASELFNNTKEDFSNEDNFASGTSSGIEYAVYSDTTKYENMRGVYLQGNTVAYIRAYADEKSGLKPYEGILKNIGLTSPLK